MSTTQAPSGPVTAQHAQYIIMLLAGILAIQTIALLMVVLG
jgi:hypothetical protein